MFYYSPLFSQFQEPPEVLVVVGFPLKLTFVELELLSFLGISTGGG